MSASDLLAEALDLVHGDLTRYVAFPSSEAADAVTLWTAATHCQGLWEHATRLVVKSPVKRCGKSRLAEVVRELAHAPEVAGSISAAALVRLIDRDDPPTLVLDEADTVFKMRKNGDEAAEALRQILNLGYSRGWPYKRWDVKARKVEECATFAMALVAGIGDMPDTLEDRAVVITLQRRAPGESVEPLRQSRGTGQIADLHNTRLILEHALKLTLNTYDGYLPPELPVTDRAADVWEPLIVIADAAGGSWPVRARTACLALQSSDEGEMILGIRLLHDLKQVWGDEEYLATAKILEALCRLEESPWADYRGHRLNPRDLAFLLRPYQVASKTVRIDGTTAKGYARSDLYGVWSRYTHDPESASQASQASQHDTSDTNRPRLSRGVTDVPDVTDFQTRVQGETSHREPVTSQDDYPEPF